MFIEVNEIIGTKSDGEVFYRRTYIPIHNISVVESLNGNCIINRGIDSFYVKESYEEVKKLIQEAYGA